MNVGRHRKNRRMGMKIARRTAAPVERTHRRNLGKDVAWGTESLLQHAEEKKKNFATEKNREIDLRTQEQFAGGRAGERKRPRRTRKGMDVLLAPGPHHLEQVHASALPDGVGNGFPICLGPFRRRK